MTATPACMDEASARQALLAQAIEESDAEGRVLDAQARDRIDRQARHDALEQAGHAPVTPRDFIPLRARRVLAEAAVREPGLATLQESAAWRPGVEWGVPVLALAAGALSEVVGNPHRLDLVSLPLLGIVAWNVAIYLLLALSAISAAWPGRPRTPWISRLRAGAWPWGVRRATGFRARVTSRFLSLWWPAVEALNAARWKRVLHLSAAAWAVGVILSLLLRGLVVEYKVGWESTFLGPSQVHAILSVLRWPALLVLPFENFDVVDIAQLRFSDGGGAAGGAPWVWMYVALLLTVVVLPRLLLATWCAARESRLERRIAIPLDSDYYRRIVSLLDTTGITVGLVTHRPQDRDAFLAAVARDADGPVVVASDLGDVLRLVDVPLAEAPEAAVPWWQWWRKGERTAHPSQSCDAIVHLIGAPGDEAAAASCLSEWARPVVRVWAVEEGDPADLRLGVLARSDRHARAWLQAVRACLPLDRQGGFDRLVAAWDAREERRMQAALEAIARHLVDVARRSEEVPGSALTVRNLLPAERDAQQLAREAATRALAAKVEASASQLSAHLCRLHGLPAERAADIDAGLRAQWSVQQSVDAPQAGMAGAATGAAMGASVDLVTGGLTLGAAAALGAIVGGGAAFVAAAWRNRSAPDGGTAVQASDGVLLALAEVGILQYLAAKHRGALDPAWAAEVARSLKAREALWPGHWAAARHQPDAQRLVGPLAGELRKAVEDVAGLEPRL